MTIRVVRLGTPRFSNEGVRIGTVRRPPRGVPKAEYASRDIYDVWLPNLSPSEELLKEFFPIGDDPATWKRFTRRFNAEMKRPEAARLLDVFAALSHGTDFALGCYCKEASRCHRSLLHTLLAARDASIHALDSAE
ncbi:MAG: DUF488 family protein [Pseudomonadota bacterium]